MPALDMILQDLYTYQGMSPCPENIDKYWEKALLEMESTNPEPEFIKADLQLGDYELYDLYFKGVKNGKIHCRFIKPKNIETKVPAILQFHGYGHYCGEWTKLLSYAALGYVVCAMDVRGQGGLSNDQNSVGGPTLNGHIVRGLSDPDIDNLFFRQVYLDTAMLAKIVMGLEYVDENKVAATGDSQGGGLAVACASLVPNLAKAAFYFPFLCDFKRVWYMDMTENAYAELKAYFRNYDPMHEREDEIFYKLGYIDLQNISKRIKADCFMCTGLMDNVCPPSTQFAMYNKITAKKECKIFPDYGHESMKQADDEMLKFLLF